MQLHELDSISLHLCRNDKCEEPSGSRQVDDARTYDILSEDKISVDPNISLPTGILPSPPTTPKVIIARETK